MMKKTWFAMTVTTMIVVTVFGQKIDEERMMRDIEVAENVLNTLIRQHMESQRTFFTLDVKGVYQAGYGVTFYLPADYTTPVVFSNDNTPSIYLWGNDNNYQGYTFEIPDNRQELPYNTSNGAVRQREKSKPRKNLNLDSIKEVYNGRVIEASKVFIADYGDLITQLGAQEKIVITNQGNQPSAWVGKYFNSPNRTHLSVQGTKADLLAFRQGKINREKMMDRIEVINREASQTLEADLELLSSILGRLYRADLSKTFFIEDPIPYERLKDFGVIYYMQVYSTQGQLNNGRFYMPTIHLQDVDMETRNKKVVDLYPIFEKDLKDNMLEYGKTLKTLGDEESLIIQVRLTRCPGCKIPSTLEAAVKFKVLKDFASGEINRNEAMQKIQVKRGPEQ